MTRIAAGPKALYHPLRMPKQPTRPAPPSLQRDRVRRLREAIRTEGLDEFLVTNPVDVGYLTGFLGGDSYLVVAQGDPAGQPTIISDFRYQEELEDLGDAVRVVIRKRSMGEAVCEVLGGSPGRRTGFQSEHLSVAEHAALARRLGESRLAPTSHVVARMRMVKDDTEVALIRKAIRIQQQALLAVLPGIRPGQTELEVAARLEAEMKCRGSSQPGFQSIVAARANGSLPHYRPGSTKIAKNQPLLIDWGAISKGYHGDMTRTFTLGKWPAKIKEIYQIVLDAQVSAAKALAPGRTTTEIDAIARDHITRHGYGEYFGHGLGHGMGLDGHEEPRLTNMLAPSALAPGHVVTVEPGIYLPGVGGVRIEDDYLITPSGAVNLCSMPKSLDWATL